MLHSLARALNALLNAPLAQILIPSALLLGFYIGVSPRDLRAVAVLLSALLLLSVVAIYSRREPPSERVLRWFEMGGIALLVVYPVIVTLCQFAQLRGGLQGVDFAIFAQVADQYATLGQLRTSLVDTQWQHFLTHHFSPYLYGVGALARYLGDAQTILLLLHGVAVGAIHLLLYLLAREVGQSRRMALLVTTFAVLLPSPRSGLFWEVRDEIFALPFLLAAFRYWLRGQHGRVLFVLCLSMLFKETMFLAAIVFSAMVLGSTLFDERGRAERRKLLPLYGALSAFSALGFLLYTKILPWRFFIPTFSGFTRIITIDDLTNLEITVKKARWLAILLLPFVPVVVSGLRKSGRLRPALRVGVFLLPAGMFLGFIAISRFEDMYRPYVYYSTVPVLLLTAGMIASWRWFPPKPAALLLGCLIAAPFNREVRIPELLSLFERKPVSAADLDHLVSPDSTVIAGDYDAPLFARHFRVNRIFHGNKSTSRFDYVVQRKSGPAPSATARLSLFLRSWSKVCYEDETWLVRCAYPSMRAKRAP